jgi:hypothetical protein
LLKVTFEGRGHTARFVSSARIFHCIGGRDAESGRRLGDAFKRGEWTAVQSLRRDTHESDATCWLHVGGYCLSTLPIPRADLGG